MAETFLLTLEVDDKGTIKVQNFKRHVEDAGGATEKAGKQSEAGRLGFFALGNAVEDTARSMGVAGQASRQLGNSVERVAAGALPAWGKALGVGVFAATAAVGVYTMLVQRKQRLREETEKNISALQGEVKELYRNTQETSAMAGAKYDLLMVEREMLQLELAKKYQDQYEQLMKLQQEVANGPGKWKTLTLTMSSLWASIADGKMYTAEIESSLRQLSNSGSLEVRKLAGSLNLLYEQMKGLNNAPSKRNYLGLEKEDVGPNAKMYQDALGREAEFDRAMVDLSKARVDNMIQQQQYELQAFDAIAAARYSTLKTDEERKAFYAQNEVERETLLLNNKKRVEKLKQQYELETLDRTANAFKMMSELGGKYGRAAFRAYQVAAIGKTIIATRAAAMSAYEDAPNVYVGFALAAAIIAEGLAAVATISSQKYEGGGSGSGAVGTYNANAATGLPEDRPRAYDYYYEQDPKNKNSEGTGWRPGQGANGGGDTYIIKGDVYAQDSDSFQKKVVLAARKNYLDKGELYDDVNA